MTLVRKSSILHEQYATHIISSQRVCSCNSRKKLCKQHIPTSISHLQQNFCVIRQKNENKKKKCLPTYLPLVLLLSNDGYSANQKKFDIFAAMQMKVFDYYYVEIRNCTMKSPIGTVYLKIFERERYLKLNRYYWYNAKYYVMEICFVTTLLIHSSKVSFRIHIV